MSSTNNISNSDYAKRARAFAKSASDALQTANDKVAILSGYVENASLSVDLAQTRSGVASAAYNRLATVDHAMDALIADTSANHYFGLVTAQVDIMVADVSSSLSYKNTAADSAGLSPTNTSDAWTNYQAASSASSSASVYSAYTATAYSLAYTYCVDASYSSAESLLAYSAALASYSDISLALHNANHIYLADIGTDIASALGGCIVTIEGCKTSAEQSVSSALQYSTNASGNVFAAYAAYAGSSSYPGSASGYASAASVSASTAYTAYNLKATTDISSVIGWVDAAEMGSRTASDFFAANALTADTSANHYFGLVTTQVANMIADVSYSLYYKNTAAYWAGLTPTNSSDAWTYYLDASSAAVSASLYSAYTATAYSLAHTYCIDASYSAAESLQAYMSTVSSYANVSNALYNANLIYLADIGTDISSILEGHITTINGYKTSAGQSVPSALQNSTNASGNVSAAYAAYAGSVSYPGLASGYASDASVSASTAYTTYMGFQSVAVPAISTDYYTPAPFTTILNTLTYESSTVVDTSFTTFKRYMLESSTSSGQYLSIDASYNLIFSSAKSTYNQVLSKIFEAVIDPSSNTTTPSFRIDSDLHCLYSLDCSSSGVIKFSNNWGQAANTTCGYVRFDYSNNHLVAKSRQRVSDASYNHTVDSTFTGTDKYVQYSSNQFTLTSNINSAETFILHQSPLSCDMPSAFNPFQIPYVPNARVPIVNYVGTGRAKNTIRNMDTRVKSGLMSKYAGQVDVSGWSSNTDISATSMLNDISANVHSNGGKLRYDLSVYAAFRKGALKTTLACDSIADGTLGQNTVPYVYYTSEVDSSGIYHPFMVIASYSISDKPNRLMDVCRPPADGDLLGYGSYDVTRDSTLQNYLTKIPMLDYDNITSLTENTMLSTLRREYIKGQGQPDILTDTPYNYASNSAIGIAIDGVVIYPLTNNTLHPAQVQAEIANTGIHIGRGMGLHYHADGQGASPNNLNLYNTLDYETHTHPPLIGFGLDGMALYGKYNIVYTNMEGYASPLDQFGAHTHGTYGYHYHAHTVIASDLSGVIYNTSDCVGNVPLPVGSSYNVHVLMKGAWAGKINQIPHFWDADKNAPSFTIGTNNSRYVGCASYLAVSGNQGNISYGTRFDFTVNNTSLSTITYTLASTQGLTFTDLSFASGTSLSSVNVPAETQKVIICFNKNTSTSLKIVTLNSSNGLTQVQATLNGHP